MSWKWRLFSIFVLESVFLASFYDRDDPRCVILSQALISTYQNLQPDSAVETSVSRLIPVIELTNITGRIQTVGNRIQEVWSTVPVQKSSSQ